MIRVEGTDRRRALLTAAIAFLQLPSRAPELLLLHRWLDSWSGIGNIVVGMDRLGYRVSLKKYGNGDGAWVLTLVCNGTAYPTALKRCGWYGGRRTRPARPAVPRPLVISSLRG